MAQASNTPLAETTASAAELLIRGFDDYNASFSDLTRRAKRRFRKGDRVGMRSDGIARQDLYERSVNTQIDKLEALLGNRLFSRSVWKSIRQLYADGISQRLDAELYKTYFNTIVRRVFRTRSVDSAVEFVAIEIEPTDRITHPVSRHVYAVGDDLTGTFERLLADYEFGIDYADIRNDAERLAARMWQTFGELDGLPISNIELLETVFYREGRAYLVGRAFGRDRYRPCVIALKQADGQVIVDALLTTRLQVSILFGYTFNYFHADLPTVGDAVVFLRTLLPDKPIDELYTVLGRAKQGKTDRYRVFFRQLQQRPEEKLVLAEGKPGMVMVVFTLPSYPLVFKLLRDRFDPDKTVARDEVHERYRMVYRHDRVGRLLDAQEFRDLRFPIDRLSEPLLRELTEACARLVEVEDDSIVIRHCYVERRVRPLNLYLSEVDGELAEQAVIGMGQALKDLARSNIFAGDLLPKNFGVTRSGRVVFYDYDELMLLTECRFRHMPVATDFDDIYSPQPWYPVDENDIFPVEFERFLGLSANHMAVLKREHPELFEVDWWLEVQRRIHRGESLDVPPYTQDACLDRSSALAE